MSEQAPYDAGASHDAGPQVSYDAGEGWQRLDPRSLLIDPVRTAGSFLFPALIAFVGLSSGGGGMPWGLVPVIVVGALLVGMLPWLTTTWRVTPTQLQRRSGLLNRTTSTAPLDRIRSVDLEASLLHRVVGVTKVQIGTGVDDDRITLDSIDKHSAAALRTELLAHRASAAAPAGEDGVPPVDAPADPLGPGATEQSRGPEGDSPRDRSVTAGGAGAGPEELARIDWSWLRFAPFSLARLVVVAGALGVLGQFGDDLPWLDAEHLDSAWAAVRDAALALLLAVVVVGGLLVWLVIALAGYVVQWWGMRLTRGEGSLHLTAGLFTTRSISVEEQRVRGVRMVEPVLMRLVGGAELSTLATGVGSGGVTGILPPSPLAVDVRVADRVLGTAGVLTTPLQQHGPAARRRCHTRTQRGAALVGLLLAAGWWWWVVPGWAALGGWLVAVVLAAGAAEAAYAHLGHALAPDHLVVGDGDLARVRTALETDGIIGWVVRQSLWQRRLGLAHLVATTAAGAEKVVVRDVPRQQAVALAHAATPGVLDDWVA